MNGPNDARIWQGLRAHLDELGTLATAPRLTDIVDRRPSRRVPQAALAGLLGVLTIAVAMGGWLLVPRPGAAPVGRATDGPFTLEIRTAKSTHGEGEPIAVSATLTYKGADPSLTISHGHGSPMAFGIVEPVNGIQLSPSWLSSCERSSIDRGVGLTTTFAKSGGDTPTLSADPSVAAFMADPTLRLPAGIWHVFVQAVFSEGPDCDVSRSYDIRAEIAIEVQAATSTESPSASPEGTRAAPSASPVTTSLRTAGFPAPTLDGGLALCRTARAEGYLARDPETGLGLGAADGSQVRPIIWPYGYSARIEGNVAVLVNERGDIVAREGDHLVLEGGFGLDDIFEACGGV
jgi:hypothetical protein